MGEGWIEAEAAAGEIAHGRMRTFKHDGRQLVVGRCADGRPFALDNRCPHEGYPLASGTLKEHALTCCWHNWKFDVRDGACLLGGEAVRRYPTRELEGRIQVDLTDPDPAEVLSGYVASLRHALTQGDSGRALRDVVRVLQAGRAPRLVLAELAAHDAEHAEYGSTHALPVAADCARFLDRYDGPRAAIAIAPVVDLCIDANQRLPERRRPAPIPGATLAELRRAVEAEEVEYAEALFRGAIDAGTERAELERWLYSLLSMHFLDFGHELIYLVKAQELFDEVEPEYAARILPALFYAISLATREDTLPYWAPYARRLREVEGRFEEVWSRRGAAASPFDGAALEAVLLDGSAAEAHDLLWSVLAGGADPSDVARTIVVAAARRLWRFDIAVDRDPEVLETWLWATHRFTFASAVRNALERFDSPDALRFLFQAMAFVHSGRALDRPGAEPLPELARDGSADVESILAAVRARDAETACARARRHLERGGPVDALRAAVEDLCLSDPLVRPIAVAHVVKTACAAFEEHAALAGHPGRDWPLLATLRFLASPVVERRVRESAERSIRWVAEGVMPRKLTQ